MYSKNILMAEKLIVIAKKWKYVGFNRYFDVTAIICIWRDILKYLYN